VPNEIEHLEKRGYKFAIDIPEKDLDLLSTPGVYTMGIK